jgi:hypothetical protein
MLHHVWFQTLQGTTVEPDHTVRTDSPETAQADVPRSCRSVHFSESVAAMMGNLPSMRTGTLRSGPVGYVGRLTDADGYRTVGAVSPCARFSDTAT